MTISNGSAILAADLDALITSDLAAMQDDNAQLPLGFVFNHHFANLVASTTNYRRKTRFVVPFDCYVEAIALVTGDHTAASTTSAAVTADGTLVDDLGTGDASDVDERGLVLWPMKVTGTTGAGITKVARLLYDGTRTKPGLQIPTTSRAFRTLLKGSTITVSALTTSTATPSSTHVAVALRQFFTRGDK